MEVMQVQWRERNHASVSMSDTQEAAGKVFQPAEIRANLRSVPHAQVGAAAKHERSDSFHEPTAAAVAKGAATAHAPIVRAGRGHVRRSNHWIIHARLKLLVPVSIIEIKSVLKLSRANICGIPVASRVPGSIRIPREIQPSTEKAVAK